jgi:hypothetical protein
MKLKEIGKLIIGILVILGVVWLIVWTGGSLH